MVYFCLFEDGRSRSTKTCASNDVHNCYLRCPYSFEASTLSCSSEVRVVYPNFSVSHRFLNIPPVITNSTLISRNDRRIWMNFHDRTTDRTRCLRHNTTNIPLNTGNAVKNYLNIIFEKGKRVNF